MATLDQNYLLTCTQVAVILKLESIHKMYSVHYFIFHMYFSLRTHIYIVIIHLNLCKSFHGIGKYTDIILNQFETE